MKRANKNRELIEIPQRNRFVGWLTEEKCIVNLGGNYDYLELPYYVSEDYEHEGKSIRPTCKEMIDAYVPPLFLEKAKLAGLAIPEYYISNGYCEPPVIVDPINPFTLKGRVILKAGRAQSIVKSLTRNYTYAVCCQELPEDSKVLHFRAVLGWSAVARYNELARSIWETYNIPVARVRAIRLADNSLLLSDIAPLPLRGSH
ncbi:MAG: hypothetical protein ABIK83_16200 [Candidatus Zixiibacteriota bacterium]